MSSIVDYLQSERALYLPLVRDFLDEQKDKYAKLTPEFSELLDHLSIYLLRGGKWHRPALGLLAYQICGGNSDDYARAALMSLELVHRFLLIHDDIIDRDLERHAGPTIEKIFKDRFDQMHYTRDEMYSKGNAIVAGDVVYSMAYEAITQSNFSDQIKVAAIRAINQLMMETGAGWQVQTEQNYMKIENVSEEAFFNGMQLVSGQYSIVWPLRLGQILAGKPSYTTQLETYGWHAGAAFQIMDDILGMFGNAQETGKPVGHDYREGKKTFLVLKAYVKSNDTDKAFFEQTLGTDVSPEQVSRAQQIMISTGSLDEVTTMAQLHAAKAKQALAHLETKDSQAVELLESLANFLADRTY